ncbi:MAG TPA: redoxin domain-containing protein [Bacteroidota bacterium]|nr:redoxin domain-containing protein [Bacteroidota bacterium]
MIKHIRQASFLLATVLELSFNPCAEAGDAPGVGTSAPDFTLPYATKDTIDHTGLKLSEMIGKDIIILAFYPADWSGGCTKEMCTIRDNFAALSDLGAAVFGISGDYTYSHHEWAKHHNLQFALLGDHTHEVAKAYGSYNAHSGYNMRTIFVIDRKGIVVYVDMAYKAGTPESFEKLKSSLADLK